MNDRRAPNIEEVVRDAKALREAAYALCSQISKMHGLLADIAGSAREDERLNGIVIFQQDDLQFLQDRCSSLADDANSIFEDARGGFDEGWGERDKIAFELFVKVQSLREELEALDAEVTVAWEAVRHDDSGNWLKDGLSQAKQIMSGTVMPMLKRLLGRLWSLLKHLIYPREWKLKGELGNTVWGMTKVGVEITFGKP